ncbi:MAG: galactokinase [Leptospiraceae bacterium]|nr:MAG: galactokinase [Leptospiraceae bacterium]
MDNIKSKLVEKFKKTYNQEPERFFFAPGRVNFIGEHIDYNGGKVLPFAINKGIFAAIKYDDSNKIKLCSHIDNQVYEIDYNNDFNQYKNTSLWIRYPLGVIQALKNQGYRFKGISLYYWSNLPVGSGLSSSAAIEILTAYVFYLQIKTASQIDRIQMAILCQQVENQFIGVKCGIMDQFSIAMGKKDHLILLDTHSLEYEYLRFLFPDVSIVVINTNKPRTLAGSKYNDRRTECKLSLEILQKKYKINTLVEATEDMLNDLVSNTLQKRTMHVISEHKRVQKIRELLTQNNSSIENLTLIGKLLYESHYSLKEYYEVSCYELDVIVEESQKIDSVYGARMTGAGFGGCAIALVKQQEVNNYISQISKKYKEKTDLEADIFEVQIEDGVKEI